jgi:wyosine [tRNA(Phe)-imidazoG37] synthetase (radical SAM superfamily)
MPTLSSVFEATFRAIHRPHPALRLQKVLEGIKALRKSYRGQLFLEVMLLAGINDSEKEVAGLYRAVQDISPDRVQLNTVVRPPADDKALSLDRKRLEEIKSFFGEKAEIIAGSPPAEGASKGAPSADRILEMAKRRPVRVQDVAGALKEPVSEVEAVMKGLFIKGALSKQEHEGEVYFTVAA